VVKRGGVTKVDRYERMRMCGRHGTRKGEVYVGLKYEVRWSGVMRHVHVRGPREGGVRRGTYRETTNPVNFVVKVQV
jgi:hypothetical protein